ncbi:MAG: ATP-dependent helicase C-terminal domain-containing protein, partial [Bacteroidota bacterium]
ERDPVRTNGPATADADLRLRLDLLARGPSAPLPSGHRVDRGVLHRIRAEADHLMRTLGVRAETVDPEAAGLLVAFAYPDRIAQRVTPENRFRLRTGHAAALSHDQVLSESPYLAVASLDERQGAAKIFAAAPLALDDLNEHFADHLATLDLVRWDSGVRRVTAQRHVQLGALVVRARPLDHPDPEAVTSALLDGIREHGLDVLPWTKEARRVQARLQFLHHQRPAEWRDMSDEALLRRLEPWLAPYLVGHRRFEDLRSLNLVDLLLAPLDWPRRQDAERLAPSHLTVPSGSRRSLDYSDPASPVLAVRLQEVFGWTTTPRLLDGEVPVTMQLLSPAQRPVQVTQDLEGFWSTSYFDVRKDLRGRYPKHYWPEDPLTATPTARAKPRRST